MGMILTEMFDEVPSGELPPEYGTVHGPFPQAPCQGTRRAGEADKREENGGVCHPPAHAEERVCSTRAGREESGCATLSAAVPESRGRAIPSPPRVIEIVPGLRL